MFYQVFMHKAPEMYLDTRICFTKSDSFCLFVDTSGPVFFLYKVMNGVSAWSNQNSFSLARE